MTSTRTQADLRPLIAFMLARISEDESAVRRAAKRQRAADSVPDDVWSLERLAAECEMKRASLGHLQQIYLLRDGPGEASLREAAGVVIRTMSMIWAEHAQYRPEWSASPRR